MVENKNEKKVLILGNGLSRLSYNDFIEQWEYEIWGCNFVYADWGWKLTRITGHVDVMAEAKIYKEENNYKYEFWGGNLGQFEFDKKFTCDNQFLKDSGTTFVAQALEEKYKIYCLGFDLGGRDMYSQNHHTMNKTNWVLRWRIIANTYGLDDIHFIGHNHKPFILGKESAHSYANRYLTGKPHIDNEEYLELYKKFNVIKPKEDNSFVTVKYKDGKIMEHRKLVAKKLVEKGIVEII